MPRSLIFFGDLCDQRKWAKKSRLIGVNFGAHFRRRAAQDSGTDPLKALARPGFAGDRRNFLDSAYDGRHFLGSER